MAPNRREKEKRKVRYTDAKKQAEQQESGYSPTAYKLPQGVSAFRFKKAGAYRIDIMPYVVSKGKDVKGGNPNAEEGDVHYERTYYVHQNVGVDNHSYACLRKTFGKPCPICEHCARLSREPGVDEDVIQKMKDKTRKLFIFKDHGDPDKGFQIFETGHYKSFGELLNDKVLAADEDEPILRFYHLDDGVTLKIFCKEDSFNGRKFFKATDISAIARKEQYDESVLDEVPDLDQIVADGELSYDELKEIFEQGADIRSDDDEPAPKKSRTAPEDDDDEPAPKKPGNKPVKAAEPEDEEEDEEPEDEEEDEEPEDEEEGPAPKKPSKKTTKKIATGARVMHKKYGECDVIHVSPDGSSLKLEDDEGNIHKPISAGDVTLIGDEDEEEDEEPTPKKSSKKPTAKKEEPEDEDEEDIDEDEIPFEDDEEPEEEDEDEAPPPRKKPKK